MTVSVIVGKKMYGAVPFHRLPFHLLLPEPPIRCTYPIFSSIEYLRISMIAYLIFDVEKGLHVHSSNKLIARTGYSFDVLQFLRGICRV